MGLFREVCFTAIHLNECARFKLPYFCTALNYFQRVPYAAQIIGIRTHCWRHRTADRRRSRVDRCIVMVWKIARRHPNRKAGIPILRTAGLDAHHFNIGFGD